ncbi:MAG: phospho-N-acetylmuramoyl-pentapeptide-transferase [Patescibacteria group bacterium]|nr:phospho-N-acetylmuramoyl-pentapeptide-transferase [Candidatus Saccharibacteria bacterium]MDQ5963286.1 phospho-N-acetylmuramoyl-pentapeptide-transferase [Patescibacteria group bacterium]
MFEPDILLTHDALLKIVLLGVGGFLLSMALTPLYTTIAYKWQLWKKPRTTTLTGEQASMFTKLHAAKHKRHIPTMAGVIFILSVGILTFCFNLSRSQTWLPLAAFMGAAVVGLIDDIINIRGTGSGKAGLPSRLKMLLITLVALVGGWFFYAKLDVTSIQLPGFTEGQLMLGWLIVPLFVLVVVATANAVNISDGLDGLAGGLTATAFATYAIIAALESRFGVAGFCLTVVGALLSYTWFNVYPARFFMGDVGSFALGTALGVVAMITDTVLLLPLIGAVFVAEAGSVILQIASKKLRNGKKLFLISPIHHHFEAMGWPETKVTMRFWVIGQVCALTGLAIFIIGNYV